MTQEELRRRVNPGNELSTEHTAEAILPTLKEHASLSDTPCQAMALNYVRQSLR